MSTVISARTPWLAALPVLLAGWVLPVAAQVRQPADAPPPRPAAKAAQPVANPVSGPVSSDEVLDQLRPRGTPTGRIAAATRGLQGPSPGR